ncbi:hypothetical protein F5B19DRAFT_433238 [Rostrohypoxylon terebratum]|nr:hypothetical protein F5B19DRAFT_433238 [Rostrohypoxylon terebratum]
MRSGQPQTPRNMNGTVEDHLPGYPRFAAFLSLHRSFYIFRNFSKLRVRLLLSKQDELVQLEDRLESLDCDSTFAFFRGSLRHDRNGERAQLMAEIERGLIDYASTGLSFLQEIDLSLDRVEKSLQRHAARRRDIENAQRWMQNTGQIPRNEAAYLWQDDLITIGETDEDAASPFLQHLIEDTIISLSKLVKRTPLHRIVSRDPDLHIFSASVLSNIFRFLMTILLLLILFVPVIISAIVENTVARIGVAVIASCIFILALAILANARTSEIFVAGATYSAILVAFITGPN